MKQLALSERELRESEMMTIVAKMVHYIQQEGYELLIDALVDAMAWHETQTSS